MVNLGDIGRLDKSIINEFEKLLINDLSYYDWGNTDNLIIDWSDSCGEGSWAYYRKMIIENFSNIGLLNKNGEQIGHGWCDFVLIHEQNKLLLYWDVLYKGETKLKSEFGIPQHIWDALPLQYQEIPEMMKRRMKS